MGPPIKKGKILGIVQPTYGCSGKRSGRVSWSKPIKNHLGSPIKVFRPNYCFSETSENLPDDEQ